MTIAFNSKANRLAAAAALTCMAAAMAPAVQAQTLKAVYEAARASDATYLSARAQAESVQYKLEQARAANRPAAQLDASLGRTINDTPTSSALKYQASNGLTGTLSGRQSLFNRTNDATISQAERAVDLARTQLRQADLDLIVRVSQAYFDVLAARDALATVQATRRAFGEQLAAAKRNFEVGTATITDTREAQARFDLATAQEIAAQNDLQTKQVALDLIVGRTGIDPHPLRKGAAAPPVQPAAIDDWVQQAMAQSPLVQQARLNLDVAKLETEKARAGDLPTVGLTASYGKTRSTTDVNHVNSNIWGTNTNAAVGVGLTLPLFAGYSVQNRIKETLQLEDKARFDLEAARRAVTQATRTAFLGQESGRSQVKALEAAEDSSRLALEATQTGYRVGVRVNLDVLNAQAQLYTTQRDLAKARYDLIVNGLRLRQAGGVLMPGDVDAIDTLVEP